MKVLVTGGCGYIGSVLIPRLLEEEHSVKVVDTLWFGNKLGKDIEVVNKQVELLREEDLRGFDAVIHLAGLSNDPMAEFDPLRNYTLNAAVTAYLAYIAKRVGINKFIFASSCSVYGFTQGDIVSTEEDNPVPKYPYGIAKLMAEKSLLSLLDSEFGVIILRKGTIGGYSPRMRYDLVVNTMVKSALTTGKIEVRNTSLWRPIIDIRDIASAYCLALKQNTYGIFNILERNYTIWDLGLAVAMAIKEYGMYRYPEILSYERFDLRNYRASGQKAKDYLGFTPQYTVKDTVFSILDNVERHNCSDFNNPIYYNIEVMKSMKN